MELLKSVQVYVNRSQNFLKFIIYLKDRFRDEICRNNQEVTQNINFKIRVPYCERMMHAKYEFLLMKFS